MNKVIDAHFERVEKALDTLIKSIATYNPNPAHAESLVTADAELSAGLEQLTTHQTNHAHILSLRATTAALDTQIRDALTLLASTRRDLLATPSTPDAAPNTAPIHYAELLSYARRISKFTLPPTHREPVPTASNDVEPGTVVEPAAAAAATAASQGQTNGNATPTPSSTLGATNGDHTSLTTGLTPTPTPASNTTNTTTTQQAGPQSTIATNNGIWADYLNPREAQAWTPWPAEEALRRGALASIQILLEQGRDPATFDPERSAELEEERRRKMEEEEREREEVRARVEEERRREMERRMSSTGGGGSGGGGGGGVGAGGEKPKAFQLEDFEDEDD